MPKCQVHLQYYTEIKVGGDGPTWLFPDTKETKESIIEETRHWWFRSLYHSYKDKPSLRVSHKDGTLFSEEWHKRGETHREKGPAYIEYGRNGTEYRYYLDGHEYTFVEWAEIAVSQQWVSAEDVAMMILKR